MPESERIMGLSKYIVSLPGTTFSVASMVVLSFVLGCIVSAIQPSAHHSALYNVVYGGAAGFLIFGLTSIMGGAVTQPMINSLEGRHMKMKQSMFLSLLSMLIVGFVYLIGSLISSFSIYSYTIDALVYGCVIIFAIRILVLWGTSNINFFKSLPAAATQPILIISMVIVIVSLTSITTNIGYFSILALLIKIVIASLILVVAIYSFVVIVESPMKRNLGVGGLELLSLFLAHVTEGSNALEGLFEDMGEPIDTLIGITAFKGKDGLKAIFLSPSVHPGPVGNIGGGNMPTILANTFDTFTMVSHGPSTHDFNPVSTKEIYKVEGVVKNALKTMEYSNKASKFFRVESGDAKIGAQFFDNNLVLLATMAPVGFDDMDFGVGLAIINLAKARTGVDNVVLVECHNAFQGDGGRILPGNKEVFELMDATEKLRKSDDQHNLKVGIANDPMEDVSKEEGVGESGVKAMIVDVDNQKTGYILLDSNNMVIGFRERIIKHLKELGLDEAEIMTSDTHFVNALSGGHNPVGRKSQDIILQKVVECTKNAMKDLEDVTVACEVSKIKDLKTLGPTHATELVTTISSIVAVSKIFAPLIFIIAFLSAFIWIFYWAL
jgi:putative membrane protein